MPRMIGGQAVVASLLAHDVGALFGIISIHNLHIFDALYDHQDQIRFVGGRHEHAVGFMADGYARATGKPGVMLTSTGPGAADSVGALGEAYHSAMPLLHITTNVEQELVNSGRGSTHEPKDQLGMFSSVAGWTASADSMEAIPDRIYEAFLRLQTAHPPPIVLEVPTDLLEQHADVEVGPPQDVPARTADQAAVEAATQKLLKAKRPVIWAGNGVAMSGGTEELKRLAEALDCPVVAADGGKGSSRRTTPSPWGPAWVAVSGARTRYRTSSAPATWPWRWAAASPTAPPPAWACGSPRSSSTLTSTRRCSGGTISPP